MNADSQIAWEDAHEAMYVAERAAFAALSITHAGTRARLEGKLREEINALDVAHHVVRDAMRAAYDRASLAYDKSMIEMGTLSDTLEALRIEAARTKESA